MIPTDPVMLLSFVNTWMRDEGEDYEGFLKAHGLSEEEGRQRILDVLAAIDYHLDETKKRFR